jgi:tetratricopeptide (TPR) repeat protein
MHQAALAIAEEVGDLGGVGSSMGNLGNVFQTQGRHELAVQHYRRAIEIAKQVGNRQLEATWLGNLGAAWSRAGDNLQAIDCFLRSLSLAAQVGDRVRMANAEYNLGLDRLALGETQDAADHLQRALDLFAALYGADHPQTLTTWARLQELKMNSPSTLFWIQAANGQVFELRSASGKRVVPVFTTPDAARRVHALMKERFGDTLQICQGNDVPRAAFEKASIAADATRDDYLFVYEGSDQYQHFVAGLEAYPKP